MLSFEGLPLNEVDAPAFTVMFGLLIGALIFPSISARFDAQTQTLFYEREQWGWKRERAVNFAAIRAIRRKSRMVDADDGPLQERVHLFLQLDGKELRLFREELTRAQADESEGAVREVLNPLLLNELRTE